jgi:dienelactone hydrolase
MTPPRALALLLVSVGALSGCSGCSSSPAGGNGGGNATIITLPTQLPDEISYNQAMVLFGFDHSRPYDVQERSVTIQSGALVHDISYLGVAGKRSQAYLVMPYGKGPFGAVMYLHGAFSGSSQFLTEACDLANRGVASLLITQPEQDPQPMTDSAAVNEIVYEMREMQRSLDLLAAQPDVDPHRLGFVGFSFGAVRGATFAGIEGNRLRVAILMSTPPSYNAPAMVSFDPIVWVPRIAPASLFIQLGTQDSWFTKADGESLITAANEPKELVWYDTGHGLGAKACDDRIAWLTRLLGRP